MGNFEFNECADVVLSKSDIEFACVYVFWLGPVCQYIGSSKVGLARPISPSHPSKKKFDYDRLEIYKQVDSETARELETRWIYKMSPVYNDQQVNPQQGSWPIKGYDVITKEYLTLSAKDEHGKRVEEYRGKDERVRDQVWRAWRKVAREEHTAEFKRQERENEREANSLTF